MQGSRRALRSSPRRSRSSLWKASSSSSSGGVAGLCAQAPAWLGLNLSCPQLLGLLQHLLLPPPPLSLLMQSLWCQREKGTQHRLSRLRYRSCRRDSSAQVTARAGLALVTSMRLLHRMASSPARSSSHLSNLYR